MFFIKFEGFGNDYIVFEAEQVVAVSDLNELARCVCDRHYGAGADGITVVRASRDASADFEVRIFNPDGSEADLSGNGTRCTVAYLHFRKLWGREELRLRTRAGVKAYRLRECETDGHYWFDSELGQPVFDSSSVPMVTDAPMKRVVDYPLNVEGETVLITALQMGNPNCCVFVEDFDSIDWRRIGKLIENHPQFPERTNVTFIRKIDRANIRVRIWERGAGETFSSGTCSAAAAVASASTGKTNRRLSVHTPGGQIEVNWREDGEVVLTGRADIVYSGEWLSRC
ncbi:MAG TPA: diaminopimelate epimerase [Pyrinomonadaceae bacterium]|nr:diaminopimelate epimerase [Pyrinomonadaceae bacterium]